ncbi:MAG: metallophosphoesterase [Sandaracinus sp.]|nr:metallophosphoesterase [Myxococcales bacterium]MCB9621544.1 metallophosphoesterase [Sandaracinus sp.]MCB9631231.1 metallophosphoesterase [Sandaracinus sp.]
MYFDLTTVDRERFAGLLVVPDVHAHPEPLESAARHARDEALFLVQLGDLVDRGPSAATTVALMRELMSEGRGTFLVGNHEHKLARYATEGRHAAEGRVATHRELADFGEGLLQWYVEEIARDRLFARAPRLVLTHASFHREMLAPSPKDSRTLRDRALYGISKKVPGARYPVRSREWVREIPAGVTVVVGHDVVSTTAPHEESNPQGGRAVCLDTGGWRAGGSWSTLRFDWTSIGLER